MAPIDYQSLALSLLGRAKSLLADWLPGGRVQGHYYECADLHGGKGDSFKVNLANGLWGEFNGLGAKGKDLIDLYANIHGIDNYEAAVKLGGSNGSSPSHIVAGNALQMHETTEVTIKKPPIDNLGPAMSYKGNPPTASWCYRDQDGDPLFHIARWDGPQGGKSILPFVWDGDKWISKHWPPPRPLYGLELLKTAPKKAVLLVEGEKACDAARALIGEIYCVMSWPGGAAATEKVDWRPIYGRRILLWPDADEPGSKAMFLIAKRLATHSQEIKMLDPQKEPNNKSDGWDAADAVTQGWQQTDVIAWAKERVTILSVDGKPLDEPKTPMTEYLAKPPKENPMQVEDITDQIDTRGFTARWISVGLKTSSKGIPIYNEENVLRIFEQDSFFDDFIWYDEFHKKYFTRWLDMGAKNGAVRAWNAEVDFIRLTTYLQRNWGLSKIAISQVKAATIQYARRKHKNEPKEWLQCLKWDETRRIEGFFTSYMGASTDQYTFQVSKNFFISLVARIMHPGCQADCMPILEGEQGTFKSSALRVLGGPWYSSVRHQVGSPNFFNAIQGKWLIEIAEMDSFSNSQISAIKDMLSNPVDRFRIPYAEATEDFPRVCIFVGTTNERHYLADMTGARRFWPIKTKKIKLKEIQLEREQLFAEAYEYYKKGVEWHTINKKEADMETELRRQADPWEEKVSVFIFQHAASGVLISEILGSDCLGIPVERQDAKSSRRVGKILRFYRWEPEIVKDLTGIQRRVWKLPIYEPEPEIMEPTRCPDE